jgi:hypothetical protein
MAAKAGSAWPDRTRSRTIAANSAHFIASPRIQDSRGGKPCRRFRRERGAKLFRKHLPGSIQPGTDRSNRTAEDGSGAFVFEFLKVAQGDDFPIAVRKTENGTTHISREFGLQEGVGRAGIFPDERAQGLCFKHVKIGRRQDLVATVGFGKTANVIASNAEEEGSEFAALGIEFGVFANQEHERFLDNFLGCFGATRHVEGETVERLLVAPIESAESLFVARREPFEQYIVPRLRRFAHLHNLDAFHWPPVTVP